MSERQAPGAPQQELLRAWHDASDEQPPAPLDAAILAAARAAVAGDTGAGAARATSSRAGHWYTHWQPLAAAAGVAGLALVLVQNLPRERDVAPPTRMQSTEAVPAAPRAPAAAESATVPRRSDATASPRPDHAAATAPTAGATPEERPAVATPATTERAAQDASLGAAAPAAPAPPAPQDSGEMAKSSAAARDAGLRTMDREPAARSRVDRIIALYQAGDTARAADELRALRVEDPDAESNLPESLRDWARSVR